MTYKIFALINFFLYTLEEKHFYDRHDIIVLLRDVFHIGLVIGLRPAVLA